MHLATHGLLSWLVASGSATERRDRILVTVAGVAPDLDGAGLVIDFLCRRVGEADSLWTRGHHLVGHNLPAALITALIVASLAQRRLRAALLALAAFHLHLACDVVGSGGPGGEPWPLEYLWPFSAASIDWPGQWPLNGWQNLATTAGALFLSLRCSWRHGISPLEIFSPRLDGAVAAALRGRFGQPRSSTRDVERRPVKDVIH